MTGDSELAETFAQGRYRICDAFDFYEAKVMSLAFYPSVGNKDAIALSYTALGGSGDNR